MNMVSGTPREVDFWSSNILSFENLKLFKNDRFFLNFQNNQQKYLQMHFIQIMQFYDRFFH